MSQETFDVTWDDYPGHLKIMMDSFLTNDSFTDVTIVCDDQKKIKSHRNILSASSSVLKNLLEVERLSSSSVLYLKGIHSQDMQAVLQFIHKGASRVTTERIESFVDVAQNLKIKGFCHIEEIEKNFQENLTQANHPARRQMDIKPVNRINYLSEIEIEKLKGEEKINSKNVIEFSVDEILQQHSTTWENRKNEIQGIFEKNESFGSDTLTENVLPSFYPVLLHLVPEDLKEKIISTNPQYDIKFILSQRHNTQMVIDGYILKKKKGPYVDRLNQRKINWKCVNDLCDYRVVTEEGGMKFTGSQHNHATQPDLIIKKEVRDHFRREIETLSKSTTEEGQDLEQVLDGSISVYVEDVVKGSEDVWENIDAHKQAVRRMKRKYMKN